MTEIKLTRTYHGIGDAILLRPFVAKLARQYDRVWLETPWPQIYAGIPNLRLLEPRNEQFRTQRANVAQIPESFWSRKPTNWNEIRGVELSYDSAKDARVSFYEALNRQVRLGAEEFDLSFPLHSKWTEYARQSLKRFNPGLKPNILVHAPTLRRDWYNPARNPKPEYFQLLIDTYKAGRSLFLYDIADLAPDREWREAKVSGLDLDIDGSALPAEAMFGFVAVADAVICSPNCFLWLALAFNKPTLCLFGGYIAPWHLFDDAMDLKNVYIGAPGHFCNCWNRSHKCRKEIGKQGIIDKFEEMLKSNAVYVS